MTIEPTYKPRLEIGDKVEICWGGHSWLARMWNRIWAFYVYGYVKEYRWNRYVGWQCLVHRSGKHWKDGDTWQDERGLHKLGHDSERALYFRSLGAWQEQKQSQKEIDAVVCGRNL